MIKLLLLLISTAFADTPAPTTILNLKAGSCAGFVKGSAGSLSCNTPIGVGDGGTGQTSANASLNALLPSQAAQAGYCLQTDGTNTSWVPCVTAGTYVLRAGDTMSGGLSAPAFTDSGVAASRALVTDGSSTFAASATTATELGYVSGVTSALQTQLNAKQPTLTPGNITATSPVAVANGSAATVGPAVSISVATAGAASTGVVTASDWTVFNSKQSALTPGSIASTSPITVTNGSNATIGPAVGISVATSSASATGVVTAADWSTFNGKQAALGYTPVNRAGDSMSGALNVGADISAQNVKATLPGGTYSIGGSVVLSLGTGVNAANTFVGAQSGSNTTSGSANTFTGYQSGGQATTGFNNAFHGYAAGGHTTTGFDNTSLGYFALFNNTVGSYNTAIGADSGRNISTGLGNIAIGDEAGLSINTAIDNTVVGTQADAIGTNDSSAIGQRAIVTASSAIQLGEGTNPTANSLQFYGYNFLRESGAATFSSVNDSGLTASRAMVTDGSKNLASSAVTATELGFLSGATNNIQTQINNVSAGSGITALTGDVLASGVGPVGATISVGAVTNAKIASGAGISVNKLAALTASRATVSDGSGFLVSSATTATELGFVSGATAAIQTQLNAKQPTLTVGSIDAQSGNAQGLALVNNVISQQSATSTQAGIVNTLAQHFPGAKTFDADLTAGSGTASTTATNGALIVTGGAGVLGDEHLGGSLYVGGPTIGTALTASRALSTDASSNITPATTTLAELNFVSGATSNIQTQINGKEPTQTKGSISTIASGVSISNGANSTVGPAVTINFSTASSGVTGLMSGTDWDTFNNKQAALGYTPVNKAGDTMSAPLQLPSGTAASPALQVGASDYGLYRVASGNGGVGIAAAGVAKLTIDTFGNGVFAGSAQASTLTTTFAGTNSSPALGYSGLGFYRPVNSQLGFVAAGAERLRFSTGTAAPAFPTITLDGVTTSGIYANAPGDISISTGGTLRLNVTSAGQVTVPDGTAAAPAVAIASDPSTGFYKVNNGIIGIGSGGGLAVQFTSSSLQANSGTSAVPAYSFFNANRTGLYKAATASMGILVGGSEVARFSTASSGATAPILSLQGVTTSGIYVENQGDISISTGGALRFNVTSAGQTTHIDGGATAPSIAFASQTGTGLYRTGAGGVGISTGGVNRMIFNSDGRIIFNSTASSTAFPTFSFADGASVGTGIDYLGSSNLRFVAGATERMRISSNGIITIPNLTPSLLMQVDGSSNVVSSNTIASAITVGGNVNLSPSSATYNIGGNVILSVGTASTQNNVFVGTSAGLGISTGIRNTFVGVSSGQTLSTGINNTMVGYFSGNTSTTANNNSFFGQNSGGHNTTGGNNTFIGQAAASTSTLGANNVAVGTAAMVNATSANANAVIGAGAGITITTGSKLTLVGVSSDVGGTTTLNSIALGYGAIINANSAAEIGSGTNSTNNTLQFNGYNFLNDTGNASFNNAQLTSVLSLGGTPNATVGLWLKSGLTLTGGTTQWGASNGVTYGSDATVQAYGFESHPNTTAAAYTVPALAHFAVTGLGVGAGSAVTNQTGFFATSITGATNNAFIADNQTYTGNYFINQSTTTPTSLGGAVAEAKQIAVIGGATNVVMSATVSNLVLDPTGTISGVTVTLPTSPINNQIANVGCNDNIITTLTVVSGSNTVKSPATSICGTTTGGGFGFIYDLPTTTWFRRY